jgi:NADH:ubiquinone oxidoreductase subunit F (NADH-binding)
MSAAGRRLLHAVDQRPEPPDSPTARILRRAGSRPAWQPVLLDTVAVYSAHDRTLLRGPRPEPLPAHHHRYGQRPRTSWTQGDRLLDLIESVGLTGRGGAHFPAATKWRTALNAGGGGTVVANGAEGEPASAKDTALLEHRPHLVLDGLSCAAEAVDAREAIVWLHHSAVNARRSLLAALRERRTGAVDTVPIRVTVGPDAYLTGESSALVRALDGGPALPTFNPVPAAVRGIGNRPTLVHNVETLARVALLARPGGTAQPPGVLLTVLADDELRVVEAPPRATLGDVLAKVAPDRPATSAILVGGYGGSWLPWDDAAHLRLTQLDSGPASSISLGAGVIAPLPAHACGLVETAAVLDYLHRSSARQCGPCMFGTRELADRLEHLARGDDHHRAAIRKIDRLLDELRGACGLPYAAAQLARTALTVFADEIGEHLQRGRCSRPLPYHPLLPIPGRPG